MKRVILFSELGKKVDLEQLIQAMPKGRLLTPQEGCGFSEIPHKRIVGKFLFLQQNILSFVLTFISWLAHKSIAMQP